MVNNKIKDFENLVKEGKKILEDCGWDGSRYSRKSPEAELYSNFLYRGMEMIRETLGNNSSFYKGLEKIVEDSKKSTNSYYFAHCYGIIEGAFIIYKGKSK